MNQFNPFSFVNKIVKDVLYPNQNPTGQSAKTTGTQGTQTFSTEVAAQNMLPNTQAFSLNQTQTMLSQLADIKMLNMELTQKTAYLKEVLNLPKEFKDLISQVQKLVQASALQEQTNNWQISFLSVQNLLNLNSKEAVQKLVQAMAQMSRNGIKDVSQLKEMMALIGTTFGATEAQTNQVIKNLMLLYLPFLPLSIKGDSLDFEIKENKGSNNDKNKDGSVEILVQSKNWGNLKINIESNEQNEIQIVISCGEDFPKQMFTKDLKNEAKFNNISIKIGFDNIKQTQETKNDETKIKIISNSAFLSAKVMIILHSVVNLITKTDN